MYPFPAFSVLLGGNYPDNILDFQNAYNHRALLLSNGRLYTQGAQPAGVLGNGVNSTSILYSWFNALPNVRMVRVGYSNTVAITNDGKVFSTGSAAWTGIDTSNQTFVDKTTSVVPATGALFAMSDIVDFSVGQESMLILTANGNLYGVGLNTNRTLGTNGAKTVPFLISTGVKKMKASLSRNSYLTKAGKVFVSGLRGNRFGNSPTDSNYTSFTEVTNIDQSGVLTFVQDYALEEDDVNGVQVIYAMAANSTGPATGYTTLARNADDTRPARGLYAPSSISTLQGVLSFYGGIGTTGTLTYPTATSVVDDGVVKFIPGVTTPSIPSPVALPAKIKLEDVLTIISDYGATNNTTPAKFLCAKGALFVLGFAGNIISGAGVVTSWTKVTIPTLDQ